MVVHNNHTLKLYAAKDGYRYLIYFYVGAKRFVNFVCAIMRDHGLHKRERQGYGKQQQKKKQTYNGAYNYFFKFFDTAICFKFVLLLLMQYT